VIVSERPLVPVPSAADSTKNTRSSFAAWSLGWTLIRTDFKSRYHGTVGGFLWAFLKPLAMFFVLAGVFSFVFANDSRYAINLLIGLFLYDFFAESTKTGLLSLQAKGFLVGRARFPLWIVVIVSVSNAVLTLTLFVIITTSWIVVANGASVLQVIPSLLCFLLCYCGIVVGFSLAASVLFLRYRDLNQVWDVVVQAGLFLAPVIYPLSIIPERLHFYLYLWPPTPVIQFVRLILVDGGMPSVRAQMLLVAEAVVALMIGAVIFRHYAPSAAENL
jgi:lipopolysaccharide transport system permease protein